MHKFKSATVVQRKFKSFFHTTNAPTVKSIKKWYNELNETGHMRGKPTGRKPMADRTIQNIKNYFEKSPRSSIRKAVRELNIPYSFVQKTQKNFEILPIQNKTCSCHEAWGRTSEGPFCPDDAAQSCAERQIPGKDMLQ